MNNVIFHFCFSTFYFSSRKFTKSPWFEKQIVIIFHFSAKCTATRLWLYWNSPSIVLIRSFDCTDTLLRLYWHAPSIVVVLSFDCTDSFLWFYWNAEPSTFTRRAFAIATPSARQVDDEPSATSWIQRKASVSPHMKFWKLPKAPQWIHTCASVNLLISFSSFVLCT